MTFQQVAATPTPVLATYLEQFAVAIILGLNVWMVRSVVKTNEAIRIVTDWAFGRRGDAGVDAKVVSLDTLVGHRTLQLQEIDAKLSEHHRELDLASARAHYLDGALMPLYHIHPELALPDRRQFNRRHEDT